MVNERSRLTSLFRPHTNLVCIYAVSEHAKSLSEVNAVNEYLAIRFGVKDVISIQSYDYLVSRTTVSLDMPYVQNDQWLSSLEPDSDHLVVLRLVFMNRWVDSHEASGTSYMKDFLNHLEGELKAL